MGGTYRPIYDNEAVALQWDQSSPWYGLLGSATTSISATNFQSIAGASFWSIQLPGSLQGAGSGLIGTLTVQINNSNPIQNAATSGIPWTTNPLLNQPSMGKRNVLNLNTAFTANWVNVGTVNGFTNPISGFNLAARYVRVSGGGVSALVNNNVVLVWSDGMSVGN